MDKSSLDAKAYAATGQRGFDTRTLFVGGTALILGFTAFIVTLRNISPDIGNALADAWGKIFSEREIGIRESEASGEDGFDKNNQQCQYPGCPNGTGGATFCPRHQPEGD